MALYKVLAIEVILGVPRATSLLQKITFENLAAF